MPNPINITNIPPPRVDFIDPRTGLIAREWYRFLFNQFKLTGSGTNETSLTDLQVGPPIVNDLIGQLGITYDQAQIAAMMAQYEQVTRDIQNQLETAPSLPQLGTMAPLQQDNVPWLTFDNTPEIVPPSPGTVSWDDGDGTLDLILKGGNVTCKIGEQEFARVYNDTASAMTKGQIVYISGAQGNRVAVKLAQADSDANSAHTIGFVAETITAGGEGWVQTTGPLYKLNTFGTTAGDTVYLSPTTPGTWTTTKPVAPNHMVIVGFIERVSATVGSIYIKVDNGYELDELHNVKITSVANGDLLQYDSTGPFWKNVAASSISLGTAVNLSGGAAGSVPYQSGVGATTFLSIGAADRVLTSTGSAPQWSNSLTGLTSVLSTGNITARSMTIHPSLNGKIGSNDLTLQSNSGAVFSFGMYAGGSGSTTLATLNFVTNGSTLRAVISCTEDSGGSAAYLSFSTTNSANVTAERARITSEGNLLITSAASLGYGTGSGGAVTQTTSRTTGVTLDKSAGAITLVSAAGTATWQTFTVTNANVAATDTIIVNQKSGTDLYMIHVTNVSAGSFNITFATTGGTTTEQPVFNFAVIKSATA